MIVPALTLLAMTILAPQVQYVVINKSSLTQKVAYDWEGKDVNGAPISLTFSEFIFNFHPPQTPLQPGIRLFTSVPPVVGVNEYLVRDVARTVAPGTYKFNVRAQSLLGTFSAWGNDVYVRVIDQKKPNPLKRLRVVGE